MHGVAASEISDDVFSTDEVESDLSLWNGRVIGKRHRIVRHIASGGMGHVFLGAHVTLGGPVAVKILLPPTNRDATHYFCNEARLLSRLSHPNIVSVVDCGVIAEGGCYIVMEWLGGITIEQHLKDHGPLLPRHALWILAQLASALDYIHSVGIVHRDIKPDNVIFHPQACGAVKLFDFGVAVAFAHPPVDEACKVFGTPLYMAPEQAAGGPATPSTDLYGLGALALELLTGETAYDRVSASEVVAAVLTKPPCLPSDHGVNVPGLDAVFVKALARDPSKRFSTARDLVLALRAVLLQTPDEQAWKRPQHSFSEATPSTCATVSGARPRPPRLDLPTTPFRRRSRSGGFLYVCAAVLCALATWLAPLPL